MEREVSQVILTAITNKGWNLYYRGVSGAQIDDSETARKGPVDSLEPGIIYLILPKVSKPTDRVVIDAFMDKHKVVPTVIVPKDGFPYFGRVVAEFSGEDKEEFFLHPGEEVRFIGLELQDKEVRLIAPSKTYMPYDVFQKALDSLRNITGLKEPSRLKKRRRSEK